MIVKIQKHMVATAIDQVLTYSNVSAQDYDYLSTIRSMLQYHAEETVDVDVKTFLLIRDKLW